MSIFLAALFVYACVFAQDSTSVSPSTGSFSLPSWAGPVAAVVYGIYEILIRYIPTAKNWSILGWVIKLIQTIIPNNNSQTPTTPHA